MYLKKHVPRGLRPLILYCFSWYMARSDPILIMEGAYVRTRRCYCPAHVRTCNVFQSKEVAANLQPRKGFRAVSGAEKSVSFFPMGGENGKQRAWCG